MNDALIRWTLYFAGAWNLIGGAAALADPARHFSQMYSGALSLDDPLQAFFYRATWINVMGWGIGYVLAGRLSSAQVPILAAGAAGKLAYFVACAALFMSGKGSTLLFAAGVIDVIVAAFFAYTIWPRQFGKTRALGNDCKCLRITGRHYSGSDGRCAGR